MKRLAASLLAFGALSMVLLAPAAQALTVAPARLELEAKPGVNLDAQFTVINEEARARTFYVTTENFEAQGETGSPNFVPGTTGLASWITAPQQVTLAPREAHTVPFVIHVPANADPGGYFAAVFLSDTPPVATGSQTEVTVGSKIGVLVLLRVLGDIKEGGGLIEFSPKDHQTTFTALPVNFYYRFQNTGADRVEPQGKLTIKNTIGLTAATIAANPSEGNILPGSTRRFEVMWGTAPQADASSTSGFFGKAGYEWHHFALGRYAAHLDIAYGANGQHATASTAVWVFPWQLILIIVVLALIIIYVLRFLVIRWDKHVIEEAERAEHERHRRT
jgi:hypothetical protein